MIEKFTLYVPNRKHPMDCTEDEWERTCYARNRCLEFVNIIQGACLNIFPSLLLRDVSQAVETAIGPYLQPKMNASMSEAVARSKRVKFVVENNEHGSFHLSALFYGKGPTPIFMIKINLDDADCPSIVMEKPTTTPPR